MPEYLAHGWKERATVSLPRRSGEVIEQHRSDLETTVSLRGSGEGVAGLGISLDHAAITWGGGRRPGCCGGMGVVLGGSSLNQATPTSSARSGVNHSRFVG